MNTEIVPNPTEQIAPPGYFKLLNITNPFEPHRHEDSFVEWREGLTVREALDGMLDPDTTIVCMNGGVLSPESWDEVIPEGSCIAISNLPEGGDSGKDILRLVLTVAIIATGQWYLGTVMGLTGGAFAAAMAATVIGTTLLINALIPPAQLEMDDMSSSATYGIDGAKNTSQETMKVPVCYGKFRMAGNIISMHVRNAGDTQYLYTLYNAGEGQVAGITDPQINDQPVANFSNVESQIRLGTATQDPVDWFEASVVSINRNVGISTAWTTYTGLNPIDRFRLDFVAPFGIWRVDDKGRKKSVTVTLEAEYRKVGAANWTTLVPGTEPLSYSDAYTYYGFNSYNGFGDSTGYTGDYQSPTMVSGDSLVDGVIFRGGVPVGVRERVGEYGGSLTVTSDRTAAYRWSVYSPTLEEGIYEVRVRRTNVETETDKQRDKVVWGDYTEIINDKVAYRNTALFALKVKLTDQLSSVPNVTYLNHGRIIKYWTGTAWKDGPSNNPAWIAYDMLTNGRFGADIDPSRIDIDRWKEWGDYCNSVNLTFDGVLDAAQSFWDSIQLIFRAGHARMMRVGTRYSVAIEMPTSPTMMFASGNIIKGSFSQQWTGTESRANEIEVTYFDKEDNYKRHTIKVYDGLTPINAPQNTANVTLYGVVDADRATREGIFQLKMNRYIRSLCSFEAPLEAIACTVGDTVLVQHDQPAWSFGGRLESGSTTTSIKLDRPVTLASGKTYKLLVHFGALSRLTGTISAIAGKVITLSGYTGQTNLHRLVVAGKDYQITGFHAGGVTVDETPTFSVGASYIAYETDVIETRTVSTAAGTHSTVAVSAAFPAAPPQFANFMLGENAQVTKAWRINSIDLGSTDMTRRIDCFEYAPEIYDWTGTSVQPEDSYTRAVPHVTDLSIAELSRPDGTAIVNELAVSWKQPVDFSEYEGVDIHRSVDGMTYEYVATVLAPLAGYSFTAEPGQTIAVKVQTRSTDGRYAPLSTSPFVTRLVSGDSVAPAVPTSPTLSSAQIGLQIGFVRPQDLDYVGVRVYRNTTNNSATATPIFTTDATQASFNDLGANDPSVTYFYWLRSVDASGNLSAFVPTVPASASPTGILVTAYLTNESVTLSADSAGNVASFASATGTFKVFEGTMDVTTQATFSEVSEVACIGSINASTGVYSVTAMSGSIASYTVRATYKGVVIDKVFSLAKALAGTDGVGGGGASAVSVALEPAASVLFAYADGSVPSYSQAVGRLRLYEGTADITASASVAVTPSAGITATINTAANTPVNGQPKGYFRITNMTVDSGTLSFSATYNSQTFTAIYSITKVKTGYEIVSTLPTTNLFEGRLVFLTTDDKLYRYTGSAWTTAVPATDISGQIVGSQIADAAISTAKFASGIEPIVVVSSVPGTKSTNSIFNTTDGKLYRWNGSAYVATVPTADLAGTIADAQIAALAASKVTGQLSDAQIAAIAAAKVTGQLVNSQIADLAASKVTGQLTNAQIADIAAAKVTGQLTAGQLNIGVGGGNLLFNASFRNHSGGYPHGWGLYNNGGISVTPSVNAGGLFGTNFFRLTANETVGSTFGLYTSTPAGGGVNAWTPGVTYVISFWARANGAGAVGRTLSGLYSNMGFASAVQLSNPPLQNGVWQRYTWRVQPMNNGSTPNGELYISFEIGGGGFSTMPSGASIDFCAPQVEQGEIVSAYAPRPDEILPGTITATEIADNAVTTPKLVAGAITTAKIAAGAVTADTIAANAITAAKIEAGAVTTAKLAAGAVTANEIAAGAITAAKIAAGTITANEIAANAITAVKIAAGAIETAKLAAGAVTADTIAANAITAAKIEAGAVTTAKLAAGAVTADKITASTITGDKIAANTITGSLIAADTITAGNIAAGAISTSELAASAITAEKIAAGAVTAGKIAASAITATELAANAITADKILAGAVTAAKLSVSTLDSITANIGTLTAGIIRNVADSFRVDVTNGRTIATTGSFMKVTGAPFGSSSQFIEWYGPYQANLANCTEANATYYLKTNGSAYFGGTLSAGTLTNRGETSDLSGTAEIIVGPFGTNGDPKVVTLSYAYSGDWTELQGSSTGSSSGPISATVRLYRKIGGGAEVEVGVLNVSGTWSYFTDGEPQPGGVYYRYWSQDMGGSITYTDSDPSLLDRRYRAVITARSLAFGTGSNSQRVAVVSIEE
jgi:predicted phage tail protein